jgi:hypothetical protein
MPVKDFQISGRKAKMYFQKPTLLLGVWKQARIERDGEEVRDSPPTTRIREFYRKYRWVVTRGVTSLILHSKIREGLKFPSISNVNAVVSCPQKFYFFPS